MKLKVKEIRNTVKKAVLEAIDVQPISTSDKDLTSFLNEVDKCLDKCRESVSDCIDKGTEIIQKDLDAKDRNELILNSVNVLKKVKLVLVQSVEILRRHIG